MAEWINNGKVVEKIIRGAVKIGELFNIPINDKEYEIFFSVKEFYIDVSKNNIEFGADLKSLGNNNFVFESGNVNQVIQWGCAIYI